MSFQHKNTTPQPTPGHSCDYSQVADNALVVLTDDSTDTKHEKNTEKACQQVEAEQREKEHEAEQEEEVQWKKAAEEEAERQRQRAVEEAEKQRQRAQARQDEAAQRLSSVVYDVNTAQRVPGTSVVVTVTRRPPCTCCIASLMAGQCEPGQGKTRACMPCHNKKKTCSWMQEEVAAGPSRKRAGTGSSQGEKKKKPQGKGKVRAMETEEADDEWEVGREEDEPVTPLKGPSGAMERQAKVHEVTVLAFERMAEAAERMVEAAEQTADEWGLYHAWAEWAEMRRREDVREARVAEFECTGGGWKRPQSEAEGKFKEADEGAEGDNKEEGEVGGEQDGGEEQEGGGETAMEE
ncbi:hypothetical protein M404DRAFT_30487 [Pisolithus tinctorius Marx 270]|uniref:Uncharacterized protein n=1 Tax=Pisolithus tinctorius Marx 270 TaxID=870435 RepID=A0A0C3NW85_PISTI|nr:hypothetical protein M404DRAFT_30487 [Pisolithus tinctorius Marx 270]